MENLIYFNKFYIDKEKDIVVELYKGKELDELTYIIRTPNHKSGNLISNLAKICDLDVSRDENGLKIIKNVIPASINGESKIVYIFRLADKKIANIYEDKIEVKAKIPAITKTLMSQTKDYKLSIDKTIVKSYILKKSKFKTDLHTHMNANLVPDVLIALGIVHQIKYPLYYIKKLNLKMSKEQETKVMQDRAIIEKQFENSELTGKYLTRKIDDNTFVNFADFILNNLENAQENISKIRTSLVLLKDGQSVFTNLEKVYIYRYVFCKAKFSEEKIKLTSKKINAIPDKEVMNYVKKILDDKKDGSPYQNNTLRQDKYLWIAREYKKQHITYVEITDTDLVKPGDPAVRLLEEVHEIMPKIEKETGVAIRLLAGLRRIPLTIIRDQKTSSNYLRENLDVLKAVAKSPYVVGSDFIGEEVNDISDLKPAIREIVQFVVNNDKGFTVRIHAGENDCLRDNVAKSIKCIKDSLEEGQEMPGFRLGHGLYTADLESEEGKALMKEMIATNAIIEFQLTSNVRLNNLTELEKHPLKQYLASGVKCVQGTDGCGMYGSDAIDEQLALYNLIGLTDEDFRQMRKVEDEIIEDRTNYFKEKSKKFEEFLAGRTLREAILELEMANFEESKDSTVELRISSKLDSETELKSKIKKLPEDKIPIIIAGGSFNAQDRETVLNETGKNIIKKLVENLNNEKVYFVVGHKMSGYEKAILEASKELNKKFEVNAIIPKEVSAEEVSNLLTDDINGIRISTEREEMGIYKSFNYEIFERRNSIVVAFDGNSPVSNLVLEAKNGKGNAKIYVNSEVKALRDKANSLGGYVKEFKINDNLAETILNDYPEIKIGYKNDNID